MMTGLQLMAELATQQNTITAQQQKITDRAREQVQRALDEIQQATRGLGATYERLAEALVTRSSGRQASRDFTSGVDARLQGKTTTVDTDMGENCQATSWNGRSSQKALASRRSPPD